MPWRCAEEGCLWHQVSFSLVITSLLLCRCCPNIYQTQQNKENAVIDSKQTVNKMTNMYFMCLLYWCFYSDSRIVYSMKVWKRKATKSPGLWICKPDSTTSNSKQQEADYSCLPGVFFFFKCVLDGEVTVILPGTDTCFTFRDVTLTATFIGTWNPQAPESSLFSLYLTYFKDIFSVSFDLISWVHCFTVFVYMDKIRNKNLMLSWCAFKGDNS